MERKNSHWLGVNPGIQAAWGRGCAGAQSATWALPLAGNFQHLVVLRFFVAVRACRGSRGLFQISMLANVQSNLAMNQECELFYYIEVSESGVLLNSIVFHIGSTCSHQADDSSQIVSIYLVLFVSFVASVAGDSRQEYSVDGAALSVRRWTALPKHETLSWCSSVQQQLLDEKRPSRQKLYSCIAISVAKDWTFDTSLCFDRDSGQPKPFQAAM